MSLLDRAREATHLFDPAALRLFWSYYRSRGPRLVGLTLGALLQSTLVLPMLWLVRFVFDTAIPAGNVPALLRAGLAILLLRVTGSAINLALRSQVLHTVKGAITELRRDLLARVYQLSRLWFTRADLVVLHTRIVQDSERVDHLGNIVFSAVLPAAAAAIVVFAVLCVLNLTLVLVVSFVFPLLWLAGRLSGRFVRRHVSGFHQAFEGFSLGVHFVVRQLDLTRVKAFEAQELERQQRHLAEVYSTGHRMAMSSAVHSQVQRTLTGIGAVLLLVLGGAAVARGTMTIGELLTFYVAANMLNGYVDTLTSSVPELLAGNQSLVTLRRFLVDGEPQPYHGSRPIEFTGAIELRGVSFGYGEEPVLRDVDLAIPAGAHVALAGPNGAGKSTLVQLVLGFYRPQRGVVLADGVPYDELDLRALRRSIGVVSQRPEFFAGTIRENIAYGAPGATQEEIEAAARLALAHEVIAELPAGYDTQIGEHGVRLSGGQSQRIAIARALLGRPKLLILDEPTNHLDASAVARLMRGLSELPDRPGLLVISHDPEVLECAARVYHLRNGTLATEARTVVDAATA